MRFNTRHSPSSGHHSGVFARAAARACGLALAALLVANPSRALESEQYTLPSGALADLGSTLDVIVRSALERAVAEVQREGRERAALSESDGAVTEDAVADRLYRALGRGLVECTVERRSREAHVARADVLFRPEVRQSIYQGVFSPVLFGFYMDAPTANLYGVMIGIDKVGHFFQQGHDYYAIYRKALRSGLSEQAAVAKAVAFGVRSEHTYYGTLVSGVFSNADLAANMAGFRFYLNLTQDVIVGGERLPAVLERAADPEGSAGEWVFDSASAFTLKPFFTEHLNEALNPSVFKFNRGKIRRAIRARCGAWSTRYPDMTRASEEARLVELSTWFGEDYGWDLPADKAVTLATECFGPARVEPEGPASDSARASEAAVIDEL